MKKLIILGMLIFGFSQIAFATAVEEGNAKVFKDILEIQDTIESYS